MKNQLPTCKQLERNLSQSIRAFYLESINFAPRQITCKLFSNYLIIVAEEVLTPVEKSLWKLGKEDLTKQLRGEIDSIFKPKLIQVIESTIGVKIQEILSNVTFVGNKLGTLMILSEPPLMRSSRSIPQLKIEKTFDSKAFNLTTMAEGEKS